MPEYPKHYFYGQFETLEKAIDALRAFDGGATDSGIQDEDAKAYVAKWLMDLMPYQRRETLAHLAREFLTDESIANGYGLADVISLAEWLESIGVDF